MTDASVIAEKLLQANAVQLSPLEPFTWASGWKSPIYCDNRRVLSQPFIRDFIKSELCHVVFEKFSAANLVAGVATAGIPWGTMIADQLKLPLIYVRPRPKEHGLGNQIEGTYTAGDDTVIIEDLISTGKSSLQVVEVLKQHGVKVVGIVSIFNYQFSNARVAFEQANIPVYSLTDYPVLIELAVNRGLIPGTQQDILLNWRKDPANWNGVT